MREARAPRARGVSMVEMVVVLAITETVFAVASSALKDQGSVTALVSNAGATATPAQSALYGIRDALASSLHAPIGTTGTSNYIALSVPASGFCSATWAPVIGYDPPSDANHSTYASQGRLTSNNILFDSVTMKLWVDTATYAPVNVLKLDTMSGATVLHSQILAGNPGSVTELRFFEGESTAAFTGAPATSATLLLGVYLRLERTSVDALDKGAGGKGVTVTSNYDGKQTSVTDLRTAIRLQPEELTNARGKPYVGP